MTHGSSDTRRKVALFVSGGIAAYKACEVLRLLQKAGCDVRVAMTESATKLVGPKTFEALSGHAVSLSVFEDDETPIPHIELSEWADLALVCPASANVIAKLAHGLADDLVSTTLLAFDGPVVVAPAMNTRMWNNPATQANVETLRSRGMCLVGPDAGRLACGDTGTGKLSTPSQIAGAALAHMACTCTLCGRHVLVTAGPTHEAIDSVRYLANASSGKMGYALAEACVAAGAQVTLVSGPTSLDAPAGVSLVSVTSASQMLDAAQLAFSGCDAAILSAAVADYRPERAADHKLKKAAEPLDEVRLVENPDILATLCSSRTGQVVFGFAAETDNLIAHAQAKLERKGCDLIVANDVSQACSTFGSDTNKVFLVSEAQVQELPCLPKREVAARVVAALASRLGSRDEACGVVAC